MATINNMDKIKSLIESSIHTKQQLLNDKSLVKRIDDIILIISEAFKKGKKVLFCGNGGSAADAQHIAAEFSGRFYFDRKPLYAEALHCNTSYLTAVANDYGYEHVYSRIVEGIGQQGDILVSLSTSGNSTNVINAIIKAKELKLTCIGLTGEKDSKMSDLCDVTLKIPSHDTPRIQEAHLMIGHIICQLVEAKLFIEKP